MNGSDKSTRLPSCSARRLTHRLGPHDRGGPLRNPLADSGWANSDSTSRRSASSPAQASARSACRSCSLRSQQPRDTARHMRPALGHHRSDSIEPDGAFSSLEAQCRNCRCPLKIDGSSRSSERRQISHTSTLTFLLPRRPGNRGNAKRAQRFSSPCPLFLYISLRCLPTRQNTVLLLDVPVTRQRETDLARLESDERCLRPPITDIRAESESRHAGKRRFSTTEHLYTQALVNGIRETGCSAAQARARHAGSATEIRTHP